MVPPAVDEKGMNLDNGFLDPKSQLTVANPELAPGDY
jgi:hypothetical protein